MIRLHIHGLSDALVKQWKCIKYHSKSKNTLDRMEMPKQDVVGDLLMEEDTIQDLVRSLMVDKRAQTVIKSVTGNDDCSVQYVLVYFIGQLCGIELSDSTTTDGEVAPKDMLSQLGHASNDSACMMSQIFMASVMSVRTRRVSNFDPTARLFDSRGMGVFNDPKKLELRQKRCRTALATLHASQTDKPSLSGPSSALLLHGIELMMDMKGTSDRVLNKLAEGGITRPASVLRMWVQDMAASIELDPRSPPPPGMVGVNCNTFDNADFHLYGRVVSVIPTGTIRLGVESSDHQYVSMYV